MTSVHRSRACLLVVPLLVASTSVLPAQAPAGTSAQRDSLVAVTQRWWRAFATGDTARMRALSAPDLMVTLSTSEAFGRDSAIRIAALSVDSSAVTVAWEHPRAASFGEGAAVVTGRMNERIRGVQASLQATTVLARVGGTWQVVAAQTTRINAASRRVTLTPGALQAFAGRYRVPAGLLTVEARDSTLVLRAPNGTENVIEPVAATVFELRDSRARFDNIRFVFERDGAGRVVMLTRLTPTGLASWERVP